MRVIGLLLLLALAVRSELPRKSENKVAKKDPVENLYQYEDYESSEDQQEILFSEDRPCPRDCICHTTQGYRIASCNRLEVGTQKFGDDITDLVIEHIDSDHPIELSDNIFKKLGLHQVSTVKIVNSTITMISPTAFHGLHELYAVNLSGNKLKTIPAETFAHNKKLLLLTLSNNPLMFPVKGSTDYFLNSSSVQELDVSNCDIQYVTPSAFSKLPGLMYLNVAGNHLSDIHIDSFKYLLDLEELDLSDNDIKALPDDLFSANTELATLHIQRNPIDTVYGLQMPDLLTLNAGQTMIRFIGPSMFNGMTYVANLNLSGNGIEKIHNQAFHKLVELNYLDLSYNNLDFISSMLIKENVELEIFKIAHNPKLKHLPKDGFECSADQFSIYLFDASYCGLEEISENALSTFTAITQINLSGNKLTVIEEAVFASAPRLIEINLADNLITQLKEKMFAHNKDLTKLNLSGNPLTTISPDLFINTPQIGWLDISRCKLTILWKENSLLSPLKELRFLNVSNNEIATIPPKDLHIIEKITTLDITNNPLDCNTDFEALMSWLAERKVSSGTNNAIISNLGKDEHDDAATIPWETLMLKTCNTGLKPIVFHPSSTPQPISEEEIWENIEKGKVSSKPESVKIDSLDKDIEADKYDDGDDDDDDDDDEDYENDIDLDVKLSEGSKAQSVNKVEALDDDEIKLKVDMLDEDTTMFVKEVIEERGDYDFLWPILIAILGVLLMMLVIGTLVMKLCTRRNKQIRYNSAIIAAMTASQGKTKKDCGLVYQQLSEDLTGPVTPKHHRYAPLHTVTVKASNLSYESSPFHHHKITPESV